MINALLFALYAAVLWVGFGKDAYSPGKEV